MKKNNKHEINSEISELKPISFMVANAIFLKPLDAAFDAMDVVYARLI